MLYRVAQNGFKLHVFIASIVQVQLQVIRLYYLLSSYKCQGLSKLQKDGIYITVYKQE